MGAIFKDKFQLQDPLSNNQSFLVTISGDTIDKSVSTSAVGASPCLATCSSRASRRRATASWRGSSPLPLSSQRRPSISPSPLSSWTCRICWCRTRPFCGWQSRRAGHGRYGNSALGGSLVDMRHDKRGHVDLDGPTLDAIVSDLSDYSTVSDYRDMENSVNESRGIMDVVFAAAAVVVMVLCFLSLVSSTAANIFERTKEMAILRSIGVTKARVTTLFIYQAFVLITSASDPSPRAA
ncbi:unnamed protein product [Vitrella brassicaformis CCMP3155]|uniref:ABC3 transporter permease C-terminal domain-containing protein n=1 Tax=Vitrella brassicaformis (strain CCMP3155) TaxID=1169540 RepID=A0A0G4FKH3_VITBC|nr:unnamed protein product [Vitrella brassicaformis CCMP3155]|eukprot:CEM14256.1 unnamed protein product [Vitrella brassicaformis CCMP3155]